ncbi:isocitrate lyase/PEP mutase family protein [Roseomonas marmotae]|uniref:Isocitrate lyase/PEP mutase family protein n=1 Tax=Roseomonas marmotae TaxID=2768161 RepID=A0ABS3K910_9PROT|nr:isocitrate lyase/PEP mutase family protein [Roseomonas marmotae]MBO1073502.1 isocitrate lyase/PEP mutase family protein [Roseomonas marmotae]QTI80309.1 isocitrate lyase/PEP mutase family protein [Roseomonas marmotae]
MFQPQRQALRRVLQGQDCVVPASVFDPISVRIAEDLGFELGLVGGSSLALALLAAPDMILVTATEVTDQARRICHAAGLPILLDADHGFGNALNVIHTVQGLESAGVAGLTIEDTLLPLPFGADAGKSGLVSLEEGVGKIGAALSARRDEGLVIVGRTSAPLLSSLEDAITRLRAYEAAGADALMVVGLRTRAELEAVAAGTRLPLILGGVGPELADAGDLAASRVRVMLPGHAPIMAAVQAVHDALSAMRAGSPARAVPGQASGALIGRVTRQSAYEEWRKRFMQAGGP